MSMANIAVHSQLAPLDVHTIRSDFPILGMKVHGRPLVYLDNAATTQKPRQVIDRIVRYYETENANIHRGVHYLSGKATDEYERVRDKVRAFINARESREIIYVRGCTEGINLVAAAFGSANVMAGDEIIISALEHHSNIVPWQMLCQQKGARLRIIPINDQGEILLEEYKKLLSPRTKMVAVSHVSNALGSVNPVRQIIQLAHEHNVPVLVDGAQAVPHVRVDVQDLDCDFYAFSGHKMYGPTGIGVLYGKLSLLDAMPPWQGGGDMIASVTFEKTDYNVLPYRLEAGTPDISGVIGLGAAIDYMNSIGIDAIAGHEADLLAYCTSALARMPEVRLIGTAALKASVCSFVVEGIHPHDIGTILDKEGVAIRTGHHCAQPVMDRFSIPATARASFAVYNTREEVDALVAALHRVLEMFA